MFDEVYIDDCSAIEPAVENLSVDKKSVSPDEIFNKTKIEVMPVDRFIKIPTNTKQRDTALRAKKLKDRDGGHLSSLKPEHLIFSIVRDGEGNEMKLDGHTRTYMYKKGWYQLPENVYVLVIMVDSIKEAEDRYDSYDSQASVKTAANNMQSSYRINGFKPKTEWIRSARGVRTALAWAASFSEGMTGQKSTASPTELVHEYLDSLMVIDSLNAPSRIFPAPYLAASLAIIHKFGDEALPFFEKYKLGNETVENGEQNSVYIINHYIKSEIYLRLKSKKSIKESVKFVNPAAVFVNAFMQWYSNPESDWSKGASTKTESIRSDLIVAKSTD